MSDMRDTSYVRDLCNAHGIQGYRTAAPSTGDTALWQRLQGTQPLGTLQFGLYRIFRKSCFFRICTCLCIPWGHHSLGTQPFSRRIGTQHRSIVFRGHSTLGPSNSGCIGYSENRGRSEFARVPAVPGAPLLWARRPAGRGERRRHIRDGAEVTGPGGTTATRPGIQLVSDTRENLCSRFLGDAGGTESSGVMKPVRPSDCRQREDTRSQRALCGSWWVTPTLSIAGAGNLPTIRGLIDDG